MRTKTLLLTAALTAAGVAASMAQVYSVNVVGYVNVTVPAGKWAVLANPLNNADNTISTVLPLPASADGAYLYRFDAATGGFKDALTFLVDLGGWLDTGTSAVATDVLAPGEAFFVQAPLGSALNLTFVGEVPQGTLTVPIAGTGRFSLVGSAVPQESNVGDTTANANGTMQFPAAGGDLIYTYNPVTQNYDDAWTYIDDLGAGTPGWAQTDFDHPLGPSIPVANGFWIQKATVNPAANWVRTFTVQ